MESKTNTRFLFEWSLIQDFFTMTYSNSFPIGCNYFESHSWDISRSDNSRTWHTSCWNSSCNDHKASWLRCVSCKDSTFKFAQGNTESIQWYVCAAVLKFVKQRIQLLDIAKWFVFLKNRFHTFCVWDNVLFSLFILIWFDTCHM